MLKPRFIDLPAFKAVGLKGNFDKSTRQQIGDLWEQFNNLDIAIPGAWTDRAYGICLPPMNPDGPFDYYTALQVSDDCEIPEGLVAVDVPAQYYAVFTHKLDNPDVSESLYPTIRYIWDMWLPASNYDYTGGPDFELYDDRFVVDDATGPEGEFDIYVPVRAK